MAFYGEQMQRTTTCTIPGAQTIDGVPIDLDKRIVTYDNEIVDADVSITHQDGVFTIKVAGNYYVSWFINLKTGLGNDGVSFSLLVDEDEIHEGSKRFTSTNSVKTGQFVGSALIHIDENHTCNLGLYNTSNFEATLASNGGVTANITIQPYVVGSYSSAYGLIGMNLQLDDANVLRLDYNNPILFNKNSTATKQFEYLFTTHEIKVIVGGNFIVHWSVNLDGSGDADAISFDLVCKHLDGTTETVAAFQSTLVLQNHYSGFSFFQAISGDLLTFVNVSKKGTTGASLTFSNITTKATLSIVGHS